MTPSIRFTRPFALDTAATVHAALVLAVLGAGCGGPRSKAAAPPIEGADAVEGERVEGQPPAAQRRSTRRGTRVQVVDGPAFTIPDRWVAWHEEYGHAIFLSGAAVAEVELRGDFDAELGTLVDAVFPLTHCAFQGSDDGWAGEGVGFTNATVRVYVLPMSESAAEQLLDTVGAAALRNILSRKAVNARNAAPADTDPPPTLLRPGPLEGEGEGEGDGDGAWGFAPRREIVGAWRRSVFQFPLHYMDYGATAVVEVHLRGRGHETVAVVVMRTDAVRRDDAAVILASIE